MRLAPDVVMRRYPLGVMLLIAACGGKVETTSFDPPEPSRPTPTPTPTATGTATARPPTPSPAPTGTSSSDDEPSSPPPSVAPVPIAKGASEIVVGSWMAGETMEIGDTCFASQREHTLDLTTGQGTARICVVGADGKRTLIVTNTVTLTTAQRSAVHAELAKLSPVSTNGAKCATSGPRYEIVVAGTVYWDCASFVRPIDYVNGSIQPSFTVLDGILMPGG